MNKHSHRTALVTGASRGLGRALALELLRRGWNVIIDARSEADLEELENRVADAGRLTVVAGDVTEPAHRRGLRIAAAAAGRLDLVVNNAGALGPSPQPALLDYPVDVLEAVYRANVTAPLAVVQSVRSTLAADAIVINVTSDAAVEPYPGWGGYGSSKAALEQWTAVLAAENPSWHVYSVDPGDMRTRMHQDAFPGEDISDRPLPEESVPGFVALIEGRPASGRYRAREVGDAAGPASSPESADAREGVA